MLSIDNLNDGLIYLHCTACMSVWSDAASWANANKHRITRNPAEAKHIIVLGCQVTDMAIMNDLLVARRFATKYKTNTYISGCLANREDIELPKLPTDIQLQRLSIFRSDYTPIVDSSLVEYEPPYWKHPNMQLARFAGAYPLRISVGCVKNCNYCTIRHTRGPGYDLDPDKNTDELASYWAYTGVPHTPWALLVADSPSAELISTWCDLAIKYRFRISIRNIEPSEATKCADKILALARKDKLAEFYMPIQSLDKNILSVMHRNVDATLDSLGLIAKLRAHKVLCYTNIIIDYCDPETGKLIPDMSVSETLKYFDDVQWNTYWNGKFDLEQAKDKFKRLYPFYSSNFGDSLW